MNKAKSILNDTKLILEKLARVYAGLVEINNLISAPEYKGIRLIISRVLLHLHSINYEIKKESIKHFNNEVKNNK